MTETHDQATPVKCRHCDKPMSTPVVCDYCHAVGPDAAVADHFTLLGLPRRFDLDTAEIHRRFLVLSRHTHPDFHADDTPEVQQLHLQVSAALNEAYRTLNDSAARAAYLLTLFGGKSSADDKSVPDGFLGTMMMMQEELADALDSDDRAEIARITEVLQTQHDGLLRRIGMLYEQYQESVSCKAVVDDLLGELRQQLNAVSYVKKLLSQATDAEHAHD
ncbi:MAG: Fe-S protein assembly co-chaperone HscB [Phycisphaerae bacterium]|nr:Fe-S protein assembly co-chaperone HscB [Phycisphaerae bacterium]